MKLKQKAYYKRINKVFCPALNDYVYFTSIGFWHLLYKSTREPRSKDEKILRLNFLSYVKKVIVGCGEVTRVRESETLIKGKFKNVTYYQLVHLVFMKKVRVIIKRVGNGKLHFLSVMPHSRGRNKKAS